MMKSTRYPLNSYCDIPLNDLTIWTDNPRIGNALDEESAINLLVESVGIKRMLVLAKDILENGLSETELPSIVEEKGTLLVYDGNRRLTCLKIMFSPSVIKDLEIQARFQSLFSSTKREHFFPRFEKIKVFHTTRDRALYLMDLAHNGEQEGKGRIAWEAYQRDIALSKRGLPVQYKAALHVCHILFDIPKKKDFSGGPSYTDLDRIFISSLIKQKIGITSDYSSLSIAEEESIHFTYHVLREARSRLSIRSYSRFFDVIAPENENIIKFFKLYDELKNITSPPSISSDLTNENKVNSSQETQTTISSDNTAETPLQKPISSSSSIPQEKLKEPVNHPSQKPQNYPKPKSRTTLFTDASLYCKFQNLPQKFSPILSLISHLQKIQFKENFTHDNTLVLALLLRGLIEQSSTAFREVENLPPKSVLIEAVQSNLSVLQTNKLISREVLKKVKVNQLDSLQSYVHNYNARLGQLELISLFDMFSNYIELCLTTILEKSSHSIP